MTRIWRRARLVVAVTFLSGCADSHQIIRPTATSPVKLGRTESFYVSVSRDGAYGSRVYVRSGEMTTDIIVAALATKGARAERGVRHDSLRAALDAARSCGATHLVYPTILAWEDRATEWSGKSDIVEVKIDLVDTRSDSVVDSVVIKGKSGWATLGGDHPQDLLPTPIGGYVDSLLQ